MIRELYADTELMQDIYTITLLLLPILSAFLSEALLLHLNHKNNKGYSSVSQVLLVTLGIAVSVYIASFIVAVFLTNILVPNYFEGDNIWGVVKIVYKENSKLIILPIIITVICSSMLNLIVTRVTKHTMRSMISFFLILCVLSSNIGLFLSSFRINNTAHTYKYDLPLTEYIAMLNKQIADINFWMFMDSSNFEAIEPSDYLPQPQQLSTVAENNENNDSTEKIINPTTFEELISAILADYKSTQSEAYLEQAIEIYNKTSDGSGLSKSIVALMWHIRGDYETDSAQSKLYYNNAISVYESLGKQEYWAQDNISKILYILGDYSAAKEKYIFIIDAQGVNGEYFSSCYTNLKNIVFMDFDEICSRKYAKDNFSLIASDLFYLLEKNNLDIQVSSMLGTISLYTENNIPEIKAVLEQINDHYSLGHPLTKILLLCINMKMHMESKDLMLEVAQMENLNDFEKIYFAEYWLAVENYDLIYTYVKNITANNAVARKNILLASWYINSNTDIETETIETINNDIEQLKAYEYTYAVGKDDVRALDQIEIDTLLLIDGYVGYSTRKYSYEEFISNLKTDHDSDEALFVLAVNAYNTGDYKTSFETCALILAQLDDSLILDEFFVRLIKADAHYRYALSYKKGSMEWNAQISAAEEECLYFEKHSKFFIYIYEEFYKIMANVYYQKGDAEKQKYYNDLHKSII